MAVRDALGLLGPSSLLGASWPASDNKLVCSKKIRASSLHRRLLFRRRLYFWPFVAAYALWLLFFAALLCARHGQASSSVSAWGLGVLVKYQELVCGMALVLLLLLHFLAGMSCYWSTTAEAFLSCA